MSMLHELLCSNKYAEVEKKPCEGRDRGVQRKMPSKHKSGTHANTKKNAS
jgi:hypothetical protein